MNGMVAIVVVVLLLLPLQSVRKKEINAVNCTHADSSSPYTKHIYLVFRADLRVFHKLAIVDDKFSV